MTALMASRRRFAVFLSSAAVLWWCCCWANFTAGFQLQDAREVYYNDEGTGLWPPLMNLAKHAKVTANGTCGMTQPEVICRRRSAQCKLTLCDPRKHGPRRVVDGSKESWISPTLEGGLDLQYVTLTIDLKQVYQISYITIKAGIAPRPAAMILERSIEGEVFLPWQFFAETDEECLDRFGVPATVGKAQLTADDEVTCTTQYSKPFPPENGEIHSSLVAGRNTTNEIVVDFTTARFIRLRFQRMFIAPKDLQLKKRLFYAIRTIAIGGQCICNGHAAKCMPDDQMVPSCECEHGTCGEHCETCCPMKQQQPWQPGIAESANSCHNCQCFGHSTSCRYNAVVAATKLSLDTMGQYRGGGECLNCTDHTTGVNCERCEKGWFRPLGIRPDDASPCVACDCHTSGSVGSCAHDDSQPGKMAGWCECREGYAGAKCDRCATGWRGFPSCERCPCDPRGTILGPTCDGTCTCKKNVEGVKCDKCKSGYFGLRQDNEDGCTQCFCSGLGADCDESSPVPFNVSEVILEEWLVSDLEGEREVTASLDPETGLLYIGHYEAPNADTYFWSAPPSLGGNLLNAYGEMALVAKVGWEAMRGDTSGESTRGPTIILIGENGMKIGYGDEVFEGTKGEVNVYAPLIETSWYHIPSTIRDISDETSWEFHGDSVIRQQFLSVLTSVKHILIRAYYHSDQAEASLMSAAMESSRSSSEELKPLQEICECPEGYAGFSCERCSFSYYRSNVTSECLSCPCNNHADCNPETLECEECQHNTEGAECELCPEGFYGNATMGTPEDCQPCLCPGESSRSFSSTCEADDDDYICTACTEGYSGNHCQKCAIGYYGDPTVDDGNCTICNCQGGPCDRKTGQCLQCKGNTVGARCEHCRPLHYGDPIHEGCEACNCDELGSEDAACNPATGKCRCKLGFSGRDCGLCDAGFGNLTAECPPCRCGVASKGGSCDAVSGACICQQGAEPPFCTSCLPLHFGLNNNGCQGCGCDPSGSESATCDIVSGQCPCRQNVTGRTCDRCLENHWGLTFGKGCQPCNCDAEGSQGADCDVASGQCRCKPGVGGPRCDSCLPGYFGFTDSGCQECERCSHDGYVCHPKSGRCVCPPNTQGPRCQSCVSHSWGFRALVGCTACDCDTGGAVRGQCDFTTGQCECRPGYTGQHCNSCADGHYGFPVCRPCQCDTAGSLSSECDESGLCKCKPNVQGAKCDQCLPGTFALQADNPNGCTACFCFGRSASCTQAGLSWSQIRAARPRAVTVEYDPSPPFQNTLPIDTQEICYINLAVPGGGEVSLNGFDRGLNVTNNLRTIPGDSEDVKIGVSFLFDTPVYWQLPAQFLGDKILSYGGFLKFGVESEGGDTRLPPGVLATYPLIQLQGNGRLVLEHYPILPSSNGHYQVRFHESLWMEKNPRRTATRETLMVALQNVQYILIRASDAVDFTRLVLKDVSMDTAAVSAGAAYAVAGGVEVCECPPEYNSTSCQDPSIGFYRWFSRTNSTATILISMVGEARPCECNGRSTICDTESGHCKSCANYTGGEHCDRCADGYYGDPAIASCLPCPCPTPMQNFASACRIQPGREPACFCREGYTGPRCDRCAYGWFGHPELPGGSCQPCECHPFGSVSDECHEQTGQCNCKRGILGLDCSICPDRTVLTAKGCSTCEDGCTGILLKDLDSMRTNLEFETAHVRSKQDMPWWKLQELVAGPLTAAERLLDEWEATARNASKLIEESDPRRLLTAVQPLLEQTGDLTELSAAASKKAATLRASSEMVTSELKAIRNNMDTVVRSLFQYSGDARVSDAAALMEARRLLEKISSRFFEPRRKQAEQILDVCRQALSKAHLIDVNYPILRDVISRVKVLTRQLQDFQDLIQTALTDAEKRVIQAGELRRKLRGVSGKVDRAKASLSEIFEMQDASNNYLDMAEDALIATENNYNNLTNIKGALKNSSLILERKEGILYGLNPLYRTKYVTPAQEHAEALARLAHDYQQLFNATIADAGDALRASKAYEEVVGSVESAREAAEDAIVSAEIALKEVYPPANEDSLMERAEISKSVSSRLLTRASTPRNGSTTLQASLRERQADVAQLENTVRDVGNADNSVARELQSLEDMKVAERIDNSLSQMASVDAQMAQTKESVLRISEEVTNKLRPQLTLLASQVKEYDLLKASENMEESLKAHQRASEMLRKLTEEMELRRQRHSFRHTNETLSRAFINLRNKITEARHAAQGIRLSLRSTQGKECVRSFKVPELEPTIANRLIITLSLASTDKNGLIFYLPSSTSADFLAVELVNGRVRFVWDLGGGASVVSKPLPDDPKTAAQKVKWYKIIAERTSYLGKLWVLTSGASENVVSAANNSSAVEFSWLDVGPTDRLWVGGYPSNQEPPPLLHSMDGGVIGCLHSITLDDTPVGLWNFYRDHTGGCSSCTQGLEDATDDSTYRFSGEGYSVLRHAIKSTYNKYQFTVSLRFKTFDDNAALFVAVSLHKERYITLLLRDGHVVFQIGYGGDSQLEMSSSKRYNDGKWTIIEASRSFDRRRGIEKGLLKVGDETKEAAPPSPPTQAEIPDLSNADFLVGGIPHGYNFGQLHLRLPKSFLGCMSDLFIDRELYSPLRGRSNGVTPSCVDQAVKVAGFHGEGFLQLKATPLKKKSAFGLVLRTLQADAIVLLATNKLESENREEDDSMNTIEDDTTTAATSKRESYYSVALVDGRVEVRVEAGRGAITLVSQAVVNDGRFHAVLVTKTNRRLDLRVDDELQASSTLPEGANSVRVEDLYLGGAPKSLDAGLYVSDVTPFTGTLKDLLFNYGILSLEPVNKAPGVELGRPGPEREDAALLPSLRRPWSPSPGCRRARKYVVDPRAVKFGDAPNSHVQISLRRRGPPAKNFTLEFDFRTFYPDGLLFLVPAAHKAGGMNKQFLLGTLRNGQVHIIAKTKNKVEILSGTQLNDGTWHHVAIVREERKLSVSVDSSEPAIAKLPKKINAGTILYIGGLPEGGLLLPRNLLARLEGLRGCVRNLAINNQTEGLIGDKAQHERVGQCFPQVEPGSYFSGDAYIVHRKNFRIEDLLRLELDFRTSELAGVLFSITDPLGYPAFSLEFAPGKVIFSGDTGDRRMFRLVHELESQFAACDNRWHHVSISYEAEEVVMVVDQNVSKVTLLRNNHFLFAYLDAPLYIGGLPEHSVNGKPLLETRDNFKGCLRNLMIAGETKDWTDMHSLHNVLVGSCPAVTQH